MKNAIEWIVEPPKVKRVKQVSVTRPDLIPEVVKLRNDGISFRSIGKKLGISAPTAINYFKLFKDEHYEC